MLDESSSETISSDYIDDGEPKVTSADPNERKLARRLRIERRLENIRKQNMPEGEEEEEIVAKTLLQQQLEKSAEVLEKLVIDADEYVSNIRVANDGREVDRRDEEGINREKIMERLDEEAAAAEEAFNEIAKKWEGVMKYHDPLHINEELISQKEKCDELIRQKDGIIAMLKEEIRTAEINFGRDQIKQGDDIEILSKRIEKQITLMRRAYNQELKFIEEVIMAERQILIDSNNKKWEDLHRKRDQEEKNNCDAKFEQVEEFETLMTKLRRDFQEKFRQTKIRLENNRENLQQEFETIKAMALFNSERLDYNYQILKKREDENVIIKSQQKRRLNKMQDAINSLRKKIDDYEQSSSNQIARLTQDIKKLRKDIFDIERTADLFQKNNEHKYQQVWNFNHEIAKDLLHKIFSVDKILHEQQLGLKWPMPQDRLLDKTELQSYKSALESVNENMKNAPDRIGDETKDEQSREEMKSSGSPKKTSETLAYRRLLRKLLKQISDKTGFLIEDRLKELLKPYTEDERSLVRVDNVFAALNVTKKEDIEVLVKYFLPYAHCPVCNGALSIQTAKSSETEIGVIDFDLPAPSLDTTTQSIDDSRKLTLQTDMSNIMSAIGQPSNAVNDIVSSIIEARPAVTTESSQEEELFRGPSKDTILTVRIRQEEMKKSKKEMMSFMAEQLSCEYHHPLTISTVYVLKALREFFTEFYVPKKEEPTLNARLLHKRSTISRLIQHDDVQMFWERFNIVLRPQRIKLWDGLYLGLQKYHAILKDRAKIQEEVVALRRQNVELKKLLASYVEKAEKMQQDIKPPCAKQR